MSDLISRQDAIDAIQKELQGWESYISEEFRNRLYGCEDVINAIPSADRPKGEWIPVSERLPKECDGCVLVSKEDGQVTTGLYSEFSNVWYIGDMFGVGGYKVIAWMPLPKPYREDGEE